MKTENDRETRAVMWVVAHPLLTPSDVADILDAAGDNIWRSIQTCNGRPDHSTIGWDS